MTTNGFGFDCEEMIRELLPQIGIPHKHEQGRGNTFYWWGSIFEDHMLGVDCWLTFNNVEIAVDFTVISRGELIDQKTKKALGRGVIPIFLVQGVLRQACEGDERALHEIDTEIRTQISLKAKLLNGNRMTREKAALAKVQMGHKQPVYSAV